MVLSPGWLMNTPLEDHIPSSDDPRGSTMVYLLIGICPPGQWRTIGMGLLCWASARSFHPGLSDWCPDGPSEATEDGRCDHAATTLRPHHVTPIAHCGAWTQEEFDTWHGWSDL